jgi:hypothetical protein
MIDLNFKKLKQINKITLSSRFELLKTNNNVLNLIIVFMIRKIIYIKKI